MLRRMARATTNRGCAEDLDPCWNCRRYMLRVIKSGTPVSTAGLVQRHPDLADRTIELVEQIRSGRVAIIHTFSNDNSICLQDSGCFRGSHTGPSNECDPPFIIRDLADSLLQVHDCRCDFAVCSVGGALGLLENVPAGVGRSRTCCNVEGQDRPQRKHHLPDLNTHRDQPRHYRQPAPFLFGHNAGLGGVCLNQFRRGKISSPTLGYIRRPLCAQYPSRLRPPLTCRTATSMSNAGRLAGSDCSTRASLRQTDLEMTANPAHISSMADKHRKGTHNPSRQALQRWDTEGGAPREGRGRVRKAKAEKSAKQRKPSVSKSKHSH